MPRRKTAEARCIRFSSYHCDYRHEPIIALPHPALLAASKQAGHALTDAWCLKIAALHLKRMLVTGEDLEKTLVTVPQADVEEHARELKDALAAMNC